MPIISTPNYRLSANIAGPEDSPRLALDFPGFLETWRYPHHRAYVKTFKKLGCLAISYDPPGIWRSKIREDSSYKGNPYQMQGYSMFRQIDAGREILEEKIAKNPDLKVTAIGHSLGGVAAGFISVIFPNNVDSLILDRAPTRFVRDSNRENRRAWEEAGEETFYKYHPNFVLGKLFRKKVKFDVNKEFTQYADTYNIQELLPVISIPKLHIAGRFDEQVLLSDIEADFAAAADPKKLITSESDHCYRSAEDISNAKKDRKFSIISPKLPYSNSRLIQESMDHVQDWMEEMELVPR
jgi:pimeloyl-ACP methyl ester carboxylesterase